MASKLDGAESLECVTTNVCTRVVTKGVENLALVDKKRCAPPNKANSAQWEKCASASPGCIKSAGI